MRVFAIRQKSTGFYIPRPKGVSGNGGSWMEPEKDCIPRLFHSHHAARCALIAWLAGHFKVEHFPSSHESFYNDDSELTVTPVPGRDKDDMEIVVLDLVENKNHSNPLTIPPTTAY